MSHPVGSPAAPGQAERFLVTWEIDVCADEALSVQEAAEHALEAITRHGSLAHCFTVHDRDTGAVTIVDLNAHRLARTRVVSS